MMADGTHIEWTEATWNPITGCSLASPGCTNCYAMQLAGTRLAHIPSRAGLTHPSKAGPVWTGEVRFNEEFLTQPLRWKRPRMIFVCAHGDLFHESVPDEWIDRIFAVMALCPQHTFQVLTKRLARMREYLTTPGRHTAILSAAADVGNRTIVFGKPPAPIWPWPLPNVWLGVSVEDQQRADERIPDLLATPAAVRWISAEPLLGPVDLEIIFACRGCPGCSQWGRNPLSRIGDCWAGKLDWVVVGGESGAKARPMHPDWARSLRDQCAAAGNVPFFFKQWGEFAPAAAIDAGVKHRGFVEWLPGSPVGQPDIVYRVGKKRAGHLLDGVEHNGMPTA